jgi:CubicO group peptidase (beta-lactamase class C family)
MIKIIFITVLIGTLPGALPAHEHPRKDPCTHCQDDLSKKIDSLMMDYDGDNIPGASVAIFSDHELLLEKNYGLRNLEDNESVDSSTNFRTASLTKAFTATAIMQLNELGELDLDQSLTDLFEAFPTYGSKITVRHLLTHTSGLLDYENLIPANQPGQVTDADVLQIMVRQRSTYFTPGSRFRYSNTGYAILAEIVSKLSHKPFHEYLREHIFVPLGMHETVAFVPGENTVNNRAYGYSMQTSGYKRSDQSQTSAVLGDGGVYSSTTDFLQWYRMWNGGTSVLTDISKTLMLTPNRLSNGTLTRYGYGWFVDDFEGHLRVSHTGSTIGQKHAIAVFPEKRKAVLILTNRENSAPWLIVDRIAKMILD